MNSTFPPIRSLGAREATSLSGNAASRILTADGPRAGILLHNASPSLSLWIRLVEQGGAAPTITASDRDFVIPPEQTLILDVDESIDIYGQNSSGAATTSAYCAAEVRR